VTGALVVVATPIGNLADLSPRAVTELAAADIVACEDTRHTGRLLAHAGVKATRLLAVHEHNEAQRAAELVDVIAAGGTVAVVTDAGTPGISDPGTRLVAAAAAAGHDVRVVPGPAAFVAALVVSGLPTDRFVFEGFLPRKGAERARVLSDIAAERRTIVFYESPRRVAATVAELRRHLGPDRRVALARELTKLHEEVWRGTLGEAVDHVAESTARGEYVVVLDGAPEPMAATDTDIVEALADLRSGGVGTRDAAAQVAADLGVSRRRAYELAIRE